MTTRPNRKEQHDPYKLDFKNAAADRREHRRHDMEQQGIPVSRWDGTKRAPQDFGRLVDLSHRSSLRCRGDHHDDRLAQRLLLGLVAQPCLDRVRDQS